MALCRSALRNIRKAIRGGFASRFLAVRLLLRRGPFDPATRSTSRLRRVIDSFDHEINRLWEGRQLDA